MDNSAQNNQGNSKVNQPNNSNDKLVTGSSQFEPTFSSSNKEIGSSTFSETIKPTEPEVKIEEELKNVGITDSTDKLKLDDTQKQVGITPAKENTPVSTVPTSRISLPMTEEEADQVLKTKQSNFNLQENVGEFAGDYTEDSLPFFAALIKKVFKEMHRRVFRKNN